MPNTEINRINWIITKQMITKRSAYNKQTEQKCTLAYFPPLLVLPPGDKNNNEFRQCKSYN